MRGHSIQQQSEQVLKVAVRGIFSKAPQLHFASRLTSLTRNVSFRRSDSKCLSNESALSNYTHQGMLVRCMKKRFDLQW